jgi:hypothetical protein
MYRRFWFEFEPIGRPTAPNLGCGITAYNRADAMGLLEDFVFTTEGPLNIVRVVEDVKIDDLEKNHVLPNLGKTYERGIWFPQGYTY